MPGLFHTSFQPGKPPRGTHTRSLTDIPYRFPLTKYSTIPNTVHVTASDPNQRRDPLRGVSFAGPQRVGAHFSHHAARVDPVATRHAPFL
jgi:hypothetical protein